MQNNVITASAAVTCSGRATAWQPALDVFSRRGLRSQTLSGKKKRFGERCESRQSSLHHPGHPAKTAI